MCVVAFTVLAEIEGRHLDSLPLEDVNIILPNILPCSIQRQQ